MQHERPYPRTTPWSAAAWIGSLRIVAAWAGTRTPEGRTLASAAATRRLDLLAKCAKIRSRLSAAILCSAAVLCGCGPQEPPPGVHPRLAVFSPALTKMLFEMGLGDHVVGVTSFCSLPEGEQRPVVGNALSIRVEPILAVQPDWIISQLEPRHFDAVHAIDPEIQIETLRIETLDDIAAAMERVGQITGKPEVGSVASRVFRGKLQVVRRRSSQVQPKPVMFVVGYEEPLGAGRETFLDEMLTLAGGKNVLAEHIRGWKKPSLEVIIELAPEVIVCQCSPGRETAAVEYWKTILAAKPATRVIAVTDTDWTLPAGHLADYTAKLQQLIFADALSNPVQP